MGEKKQIHISVKDKIACLVDEEQFLVCGNNDYDVVFDFDSDWEGISAKTAVFVYGNTPIHQPFVGNICEGVEIKNSTICAIGVFAGDIKTTTGATIECKTSIRDFGGVPKPPSKEVYDEIMDLLNKAISGGGGGNVDLSEIEKQLANKVDKTTKTNVAYATDGNGNPVYIPVYKEAVSESLVRRQSSGDIIVPNIPAKSVHATSKKYVDNAVNPIAEKQIDLEERVADLESLTLTYIKDSATAYEKVAPAECGKYAMIKSIGGATEVIGKSKNLINPEKIELYYKTGEDWNVCPYTINADGSITFTVKLEYGIGAIATIRMPNGEAKYYYFAEGNFSLISEFESLQIEFDLPEGEEYGDAFYAPEKTFTLKIMAFIKEGDTESGWEVAPEGTVFEPYVEPHFKHANVERVDTLGKNLAYKQYGIKSSGAALDTTILTADTTNKHCYSMIQVKGGTKYTLSKSGSTDNKSAFRVFYFDREPILYETQSIGGAYLGSYSKYTATIPQNAKYLYVRWTEDDEKYPCGDVQIELGDTATEYSPFKSEPLDTLVFPESARCKFGIDDIDHDYLRLVDGRVEKVEVCEETVLNGTENWIHTYTNSDNGYFYIKIGDYGSTVQGKCISDRYPTVTISSSNTNVGIYIANSSNGEDRLIIRPDNVANINAVQFNKQLAENPVTVVYARTVPEVTDVTADIIATNPDFATKKGKLLIEGGSRTRFINENEMPVPSAVWYVTRRE